MEVCLSLTDARTVSACHAVCRGWAAALRTHHKLWRRLCRQRVARVPALARLARLTGWGLAGRDAAGPEWLYRQEFWLASGEPAWRAGRLSRVTTVSLGGLFSCLQLCGRRLVVARLEGELEIRSVEQPGQPGRLLPPGHTGRVSCLAWAGGGARYLVSGGADCKVLLWDLARAAPAPLHALTADSGVVRVWWLPGRLACWTRAGSLTVTPLQSGPPPAPLLRTTELPPAASSLAVSTRFVVAGRTGEARLQVWCSQTGARLPGLPCPAIGQPPSLPGLDIRHSLLVVLVPSCVQLWDLAAQPRPALLAALPGFSLARATLTASALVAVTRQAHLLCWNLVRLLVGNTKPQRVENKELPWGDLHVSKSCQTVLFGQQSNFGHISVFQWD